MEIMNLENGFICKREGNGTMGENRKKGRGTVTFTVAECGEYHSLGEYHEGIKTLEEAAAVYRGIPSERMHGIPSIGINLHVEGTEKYEDVQADILTGDEITVGIIRFIPEFHSHLQVKEAVKRIIEMFPEKEVVDF